MEMLGMYWPKALPKGIHRLETFADADGKTSGGKDTLKSGS